jgi:adenine-specific DNA-methyltransferase
MARVLVDWAIREAGDRVLDPSFGGLVFLSEAQKRLRDLGASDEGLAAQVVGVDVDREAFERAQGHDWVGGTDPLLIERDFFDVSPDEIPLVDAVVGNPPYVRYQSFNGEALRARELSLAAGVKLSRLASSWAPFVVHATTFLAPGGRLAQVLPAELLHAQYARPVIEFLRREFAEVEIGVFGGHVFPGALEEVVLVLADGRGTPGAADLRLVPYESTDDFTRLHRPAKTVTVDLTEGGGSLLRSLLPGEARDIYRSLAGRDGVTTLGELASVDIGIVTGANRFFLLDHASAASLDKKLLRPAIGKALQIPGARITSGDHRRLLKAGSPALMFTATAGSSRRALETAAGHISSGEEAGLHERYKCRIREPWWQLPLPGDGPADVLLTYFANDHPRVALNEAEVLSTNTVHSVRMSNPEQAAAFSVGFYNSLTLLSAEIMGRSYGGGVLKLEPSEAESLLMPHLDSSLSELLEEVDEAIRGRDLESALNLVDAKTLKPLGLGDEEIGELRKARDFLRDRRRRRSRQTLAS